MKCCQNHSNFVFSQCVSSREVAAWTWFVCFEHLHLEQRKRTRSNWMITSMTNKSEGVWSSQLVLNVHTWNLWVYKYTYWDYGYINLDVKCMYIYHTWIICTYQLAANCCQTHHFCHSLQWIFPANQELLALGLSNVVGAVLGCLVVPGYCDVMRWYAWYALCGNNAIMIYIVEM